jgi:hypothetical protein
MNGLGTSHLDFFLTFSELHLLVFSSQWELLDLRPGHHHFLGWEEMSSRFFDFDKNFLIPNHLNIQKFLGYFSQSDFLVKNFYWRDVNEQTCGPFETYFRIKKENGKIKSLMAFVKISKKKSKVEIAPDDKYNIFLSRGLPGFIHNINGPLGTLSGRIELLKYKYPNIPELNEVLKMGFKIQEMLENLSFKLVNERHGNTLEINLNRLLREEIKFLESDLFLKHQIKIREKLSPNIPQFNMHYLSLSGILSESYHFFRHFVYEDQEYTMDVGSFYNGFNGGYSLKLYGDFRIPDHLNQHFPITLSGNAVNISQQNMNGIDSSFLAYCLNKNKGELLISGRREFFSMRLEFPFPKSD